jgi:hypothetical protein
MTDIRVFSLYHDSAACLVRDVTIPVADRKSGHRKKQDPGFPSHANVTVPRGELHGQGPPLIAFRTSPS